MPIYEYRCPNGHHFDVFHSMSAEGPEVCEVCGAAPLERVLHPVAVHYKGSGFYSTDYGKGGRKAAKDSSSSDSGSSSSTSGESSKGTDSGSGSGSGGEGSKSSDSGSSSSGSGSGSSGGSSSD